MSSRWFYSFGASIILLAGFCSASDETIREAAVAGQFYPSDPGMLRETVTSLLAESQKRTLGKPFVLVSPHAGYPYSGRITADAFKQAAGNRYDLILVLGTNHTTAGFTKAAVFCGKGFQTPLGLVSVDQGTAIALLGSDSIFTEFEPVHRSEHSIEVQLPFIQVLFPDVPIVPIVVATTDSADCGRIGRNLVRVTQDRSVLIVASSDLSHYPAYEDAERIDRKTLEFVVSEDATALHRHLARVPGSAPSMVTGACGEGPILAGIAAARARGIGRGELVSYANSGDVLVESRDRVVGYGAVVFLDESSPSGGPGASAAPDFRDERDSDPFRLDDETKRALLILARQSIRGYVSTGKAPAAAGGGRPLPRAGAFVTLRKHGLLRGCIGRLEADIPLNEVVSRYAVYAASEDPRFNPVQPGELEELEIEISVLSHPAQAPGFQAIQAGRDGVVLTKDGHSATFLPQVADEQHWGRDEFLANLCRKAGLGEDCWKEGARFETFQAAVFSESEFHLETPR